MALDYWLHWNSVVKLCYLKQRENPSAFSASCICFLIIKRIIMKKSIIIIFAIILLAFSAMPLIGCYESKKIRFFKEREHQIKITNNQS